MGASKKELWAAGCPHDANGRHRFEPRYSRKIEPVHMVDELNRKKETKTYVCDVCVCCGITTTELSFRISENGGEA